MCELFDFLKFLDILHFELIMYESDLHIGYFETGLRGYLHLKAKGRSSKKCSDVIGGNKWYPVFGYTLGLGPLFFSVDEMSMWIPRWQF
jgi:hypothetical protein